MTRIERQLELPDGFMGWPDGAKISHFFSVRARILKWHRRDVEDFKFRVLFGKMKWAYWSFALAVFTGFAELALGMLVEGMIAAFAFLMGILAQEFYEGWRR